LLNILALFLCCGATPDEEMKAKPPRTLSVQMIMTHWTQGHAVTHAESHVFLGREDGILLPLLSLVTVMHVPNHAFVSIHGDALNGTI